MSLENGSDNRLYVYDGGAVLAEYAPDPEPDPAKAASGHLSVAGSRIPLEASGRTLEGAGSLRTTADDGPEGFFKARQYLYGTTLLAAESSDPSPEPPAPSLVFYHLDPLGSTVNLTTGEDIPGGPAAGTVTAAYLYDAWGNHRELDVTDPSVPGEPVWTATPDLDPDGLYAWESYLANIQLAYDPTSLEPLASSLAWNRFTYTGHEFDPETGLYYFKARFYDPELGRFASEDPYLGDSLTPPSLHRYLYAYASPLRYVDLTGYYSVRAVGDDHLVVAVDRLDAARESQVAGSSVTGLLQWFEFEESAERRQFLAQLGALNPWMVTERGWAGREFRAGRKVILPSGYAVSAAGKQHLTDYLIAQHEANRSYGAKVGAAVGERVSEGAVMGLVWLAVTLGADPAGWADDAITIAGEFGKFLDERSIRQAAVTAGYTAAAVLPAASTRAVKAVEQAVDKALDAARRTAAEATHRLSADALQQIATAADDIINRLENTQRIDTKGIFERTGAYKNVKGHHIHAKKAFEGHQNYDFKEAFSVSAKALEDIGVRHVDITTSQYKLFRKLQQLGLPNDLTQHTRIAYESLIEAGVDPETAQQWVSRSLEGLVERGIEAPTKVPWPIKGR